MTTLINLILLVAAAYISHGTRLFLLRVNVGMGGIDEVVRRLQVANSQ